MKKILLLTLLPLFFALGTQAQVIDFGQFTYTETIKLEAFPRSMLQERAWEWSASHYKFARETSRKKRKESDRIIANAWHDIYLPTQTGPKAVQMYYTLEISAEENQLSLSITNIHYKLYADPVFKSESDSFTAEMIFGKGFRNDEMDIALVEAYKDASNSYLSQLIGSLKTTFNREAVLAKNE